MKVDDRFKERVYQVVARIPKGRVMSYGEVAAYCGYPGAGWEVGQIAHFGPGDLPWQRVVNKQGGLARGYTGGGYEAHRAALEAEGVTVGDDYTVDIGRLLWIPDES